MVCCLGFVETVDYKDTMFKLLKHTSIRWIDIGFGMPASDTPGGHESASQPRAAEIGP
jgi:hypothetical protein